MRGRLVVLAVAAAAVAVPAAQAETLTINVTSVSLSAKQTDRAPKGWGKGDSVEYRDRLLNAAPQFGRAKGAVVGSDRGTMTFTSSHSATFAGVAVLPDGTLTLRGKVVALANKSMAIPVSGGTGRYAKARGYVVVGPGDKSSLNTYTLTLPSAPIA